MIDLRGKQLVDGKTLSDCNIQKESSVSQDIMTKCNEVNCMVKELGVKPQSRETMELENLTDQVAQDLYSVKERHESRSAHELPKCDDVQQMKHTFTRFYAKHVEGHTGCVEEPRGDRSGHRMIRCIMCLQSPRCQHRRVRLQRERVLKCSTPQCRRV